MAEGVTLDTRGSYPRLGRFHDFLGDGEVHQKYKDTVLTGSASSIEWYIHRLCAVEIEKIDFFI
jgi:hypothetical protein